MPGLGLIGALRLATPTSLWARRLYSDTKLARSQSRDAQQHQRYAHIKHRLYDTVGGAPHLTRD
jgi:hypothetical protein